MSMRALALFPGFLLLAAGCVGDLPSAPPSGQPDAGGGGGDAPPGLAALSGTAVDYFSGDPLPGIALATVGLTPELASTSDANGDYSFDQVPTGVVFEVRAQADQFYRPTLNPRVRYDGDPLVANVALISIIDAQRQHATVGLPVEPNTSILVGELLKGDGTPRDGVLAGSIQLLDALGEPVGQGPYFFGVFDVDPLLQQSVIHQNRARFAYLNVPPGSHTLNVLYPEEGGGGGGGGGGDQLKTSEVALTGAGAAIVRVNDRLDGGMGGGL
jgi:hypothetical protein